jgi:hypothetical protein
MLWLFLFPAVQNLKTAIILRELAAADQEITGCECPAG